MLRADNPPMLPTESVLVRFAASAVVCGAVLAGAVGAQQLSGLERRKVAKLAEPWLKNARWELSFAAAKERAAREQRVIFAYFTRSYAP